MKITCSKFLLTRHILQLNILPWYAMAIFSQHTILERSNSLSHYSLRLTMRIKSDVLEIREKKIMPTINTKYVDDDAVKFFFLN